MAVTDHGRGGAWAGRGRAAATVRRALVAWWVMTAGVSASAGVASAAPPAPGPAPGPVAPASTGAAPRPDAAASSSPSITPRPPLPPPAADPRWRELQRDDGVVVRTAPSGLAPPWGEAEGVIEAPVDAVLAHLHDFPRLATEVPRLEKLRVLASHTDADGRGGDALVYFSFDLPWPISDRDYTARYRWRLGDDGTALLLIDEERAAGPPPGSAVRVPMLRGLWRLSPAPHGATRARFDSLIDLGGRLPQSVTDETAWKQPLESLRGVRRALGRASPPARP